MGISNVWKPLTWIQMGGFYCFLFGFCGRNRFFIDNSSYNQAMLGLSSITACSFIALVSQHIRIHSSPMASWDGKG